MARQHRFRNWAGTHSCRPKGFHRPRTEAEIVAVVRAAAADKVGVRLVGAGHSWNDIACTDEHLVSLDDYNRVLEADAESHRITVEAGIRLEQLNVEVAAHGLGLSNLGSIAKQSIAGAISTGTHGSGARFGNLATQVIALRLVTADGSVRTLSATEEPELFAAACVGLGCLGIISTVTLQCEAAFRLEEDAHSLAFDEAVAHMQSLVDAHEHCKLWWLPHTKRVQVYCYDRTQRPTKQRNRIAAWLDESALSRGVFALLLRAGRLVPALIPAINWLVAKVYFVRRRRIDRSDRILNIPMPARHREVEYAIPREHAPEALRRIRELIKREGLKVNHVLELRFVAADENLLSPAHGRATCQIGAYMFDSRDLDRYFDGFEQLMIELDGRPHWGKEFRASGAAVRAMYPAWQRFDAIRRTLDPDGMFANEFIWRVFERPVAQNQINTSVSAQTR